MNKTIQKLSALTLAFVLLLMLLPVTASAATNAWDGSVASSFAGGSGTDKDPYQIKTAAQLAYLAKRASTADVTGYYSLLADLDLNQVPWTPIGNETYSFKGTFYGNGHTIKNLYIYLPSSNYVGLFGHTSGSTIRSINLQDVYVQGNNYTGALIGRQSGNDTLGICTVTGYVFGGYVGGLVGYAGSGMIYECYNEASVSGTYLGAGGIAGLVERNGSVIRCANGGAISSSRSGAGGISGGGGLITNCMNFGSVNSQDEAGGIVSDISSVGGIANCGNLGTVTSAGNAGGIVSFSVSGVVLDCFNAGSVSSSGSSYIYYCGGIGGYAQGSTFQNCYNLSGTASRLVGYMPLGEYANTLKNVTTVSSMNTQDFISKFNANLDPDIEMLWTRNAKYFGGLPYLPLDILPLPGETYEALTINSLQANKTSAVTGDTITWTAAASGGSGTLQYCFYVYKDGSIVQKGSYGSAKTCSYSAKSAGSYTAKVFVKDGKGNSVSLTSGKTIVSAPQPLSVSSIKADRTSAYSGNTITWTAAASGGSGTLQYCFYVYKDGVIVQKGSYGSAKTCSYTAKAVGTYTAKVFVKDSKGTSVNLASGKTVVSEATPLRISSVKADVTSATVGDTITWTAAASGGGGTLQYCFYIYKDGSVVKKGSYSTEKSFRYVPAASGYYTAKVFVKDSLGNSLNLTSGKSTVSAGPLTIDSFRTDWGSAVVGDKITWTASASGGIGTLQYCFYVYKNGTIVQKGTYGSAKTCSFTVQATGDYYAKVFVKDSSGKSVSQESVLFTATEASPPVIAGITADKNNLNLGQSVTWTASAHGGGGTLQYCFYIYKDGNIEYKSSYSTSRSITYTPADTGNYSAKVFVKDNAGNKVSLSSNKVSVDFSCIYIYNPTKNSFLKYSGFSPRSDGTYSPYYDVYFDGQLASVCLTGKSEYFYNYQVLCGFYKYAIVDGIYEISMITNVYYTDFAKGDVVQGRLYNHLCDGVKINAKIVDVSGRLTSPVNSVERLETLLNEGYVLSVEYVYTKLSDQCVPVGVIYVTDIQ